MIFHMLQTKLQCIVVLSVFRSSTFQNGKWFLLSTEEEIKISLQHSIKIQLNLYLCASDC